MKIQLQNTVCRKITPKCFICRAVRFGSIPSMSLIVVRCTNTEEKCDYSNLYNDKIFKL
jgi:hypothetical protein